MGGTAVVWQNTENIEVYLKYLKHFIIFLRLRITDC